MDTTGALFEQRVREWLGPSRSEIDFVFALGSTKSPDDFARTLVARVAGSGETDYDRWMELFRSHEVREIVYGALVGRRTEALAGEPHTRRVMARDGTGPDGFEWLFDWFDWLRRPERDKCVMAARPLLSPKSEVDVHHVVADSRFVPHVFRLRNDAAPFPVELETDGWVVSLLSAFDGKTPVAEVCAAARAQRMIPPRSPTWSSSI